jgi:hypothetical protein
VGATAVAAMEAAATAEAAMVVAATGVGAKEAGAPEVVKAAVATAHVEVGGMAGGMATGMATATSAGDLVAAWVAAAADSAAPSSVLGSHNPRSPCLARSQNMCCPHRRRRRCRPRRTGELPSTRCCSGN